MKIETKSLHAVASRPLRPAAPPFSVKLCKTKTGGSKVCVLGSKLCSNTSSVRQHVVVLHPVRKNTTTNVISKSFSGLI